MTFLSITYIGAMDPPRILYDGESVENECFVLGPISYGRVLFTEPPMAIHVRGNGVTIRDCLFTDIGALLCDNPRQCVFVCDIAE